MLLGLLLITSLRSGAKDVVNKNLFGFPSIVLLFEKSETVVSDFRFKNIL